MKTWIDFDRATVFAIPLTDEVGGMAVCEGMLIEGPQGWGEFSPPPGCDDRRAGRWLTAAVEAGTVGWPDPVRGSVPVAATVPAVSPERARALVVAAGCRSAAVRVGEGTLAADIARVEAVREALGPGGAIRCDANGRWDLETAAAAIPVLDAAAGGLEFVAQPCRDLDDLRAVRSRVDVPIAVYQSIGESADPRRVDVADAADIAVLAVGPLGGVRRALRVAETCGLPCVVAAGLESSVGIAGGLALAGVLPEIAYAAELGGAALLAGDVVSGGRSLRPVDGHLPVAPMPPGPDPHQVRRFSASGQAVRRWRARLDGARKAS